MFLLRRIIERMVKLGTLVIVAPDGHEYVFAKSPKPYTKVRLHDAATPWRLALNPNLAVGEAYMDGRLTVEDGELYDFIDWAFANIGWGKTHWISELSNDLRGLFRRFHQFNPIGRAQRNVAHHYDLTGALYDLFLDADRQYSCAYFTDESDSLEAAQLHKKRHLAAKLNLKPGQRVLDIGCGWGGLALYLAQIEDVHVTGVTLSVEQHKVACRRAEEMGLKDRVDFRLLDYRKLDEKFDRIVSVGMFEHVGVNHYREFFGKCHDLLDEDGVALLHSIGRADGPGHTSPWIAKYIFPGGYSPALSEVLPAVEKTGFYVTDIEILRLHYAQTLRHWREAFKRRQDEAAELLDERFCRMWEFYLAASEAVFRHGGHIVFQMQFTKNQEAIPLTRDYIFDWERNHAPALPRGTEPVNPDPKSAAAD